MNSCRKGKSGERELAAKCRELGVIGARRGKQYSGSEDSPDVVAWPGVHLESKRTERLQLRKAVEQANRDAGENVPVVAHRWNRGEWLLIVPLPRLLDFARIVLKEVGE